MFDTAGPALSLSYITNGDIEPNLPPRRTFE